MKFGPLLREPGRHYPGFTAQVRGTFKDDDDAAFDPDGVTFSLMSPSGALSSYVYDDDDEVSRTGAGSYLFSGVLNEPGSWVFQWKIEDSSVVAIQEGYIVVQATPFYEFTQTAYS